MKALQESAVCMSVRIEGVHIFVGIAWGVRSGHSWRDTRPFGLLRVGCVSLCSMKADSIRAILHGRNITLASFAFQIAQDVKGRSNQVICAFLWDGHSCFRFARCLLSSTWVFKKDFHSQSQSPGKFCDEKWQWQNPL